jgi:hypothetical protein
MIFPDGSRFSHLGYEADWLGQPRRIPNKSPRPIFGAEAFIQGV